MFTESTVHIKSTIKLFRYRKQNTQRCIFFFTTGDQIHTDTDSSTLKNTPKYDTVAIDEIFFTPQFGTNFYIQLLNRTQLPEKSRPTCHF